MAIPDSRFKIQDGGAGADFIGEAIAEVIAARHESDQLFGRIVTRLELVERENIELRKQFLEKDLVWYTEEQLAARMQCSVDTLQRLRRRKKIPYERLTARLIRYCSLDEPRIAKLLRVEPKPEVARPSGLRRRGRAAA